jgi:hypothetical protein
LSEKSWIRASPEALAKFFLKCNTKQEFRQAFLRRPIETLKENNIEVSEEAAKEILRNIETLGIRYKKDLAMIPDWGEYGLELLENGWGLWIRDSEHSGAIP